MPAIHNQLTRGPVSRALKVAVGDTKGLGGVERYGETLTPTIDLWHNPEWAFLRDETLLARRVVQAAVAGEFGAVGMVNPAGSGFLTVVEQVTASAAVAFVFELDVATEAQILASLAVSVFGLARDRRLPAATGATQVVAGSDAAAFIGQALERRGSPGVNQEAEFKIALPLVLPPGQGFIVIGQVVNTQIVVSLGWRERRAFPGEL